ncbi:MAG: type II toxin-antitoxin system RelE/ParE family toxin [Burkholderiaceae bacterium]|nr:type II toxin-antitoxin system RelE/ParE family toxin [Burkholderiaceae bacterium]
MKAVRLRPRARQDRRDEVRWYRDEAGTRVAAKLVKALQRALAALEHSPAIGSPALGREIGIDGLRTWRIDGFPLTFWYFERAEFIDVARLVGQRQDALRIDPDEPPSGPSSKRPPLPR